MRANDATVSGIFQDSVADSFCAYLDQNSTDNCLTMVRGIFVFDTSAIPDTDTIDSATLAIKRSGVAMKDDFTDSVSLVKGYSASNTALAATDYNIVNWDMTQQASDILFSATAADTFFTFTLNATGLTNIIKTGVSKFGTTFANDRTDTKPTSGAVASQRMPNYFADTAGTDSDPILTVVHSAAGGAANHWLLMGV